ncbi:hypothetical protein ACQP2F_19745 [Actinoplanes sp. CA-030573]|uniref:hypothetical protein n=1 Tax=Actinoplanes sp. CA-030573 TaxID=3239898 RepID=UPI003D94765B
MALRFLPAGAGLLAAAIRRFIGDDGGAAAFAGAPGTLALVALDDQEPVGWCWGYVLPRPDGTAMPR